MKSLDALRSQALVGVSEQDDDKLHRALNNMTREELKQFVCDTIVLLGFINGQIHKLTELKIRPDAEEKFHQTEWESHGNAEAA